MILPSARLRRSAGKVSQQRLFQNLTEVEVAGLSVRYSLADGHAYHTMPHGLQVVVRDLDSIWEYARSRRAPDVEEEFKNTTASLIGSKALENHAICCIAPTASNSIDLAAAWLAMNSHSVGLLEPTFDNIYLLLRRRGVRVENIDESDLTNLQSLQHKISLSGLRCLFVVLPNNPTGFELDRIGFSALCAHLAKEKIVLVVDATFRLYSRAPFDSYQILADSGVDYIVIEDTGKTWPTQELKASLLVCSESIAPEMRKLYEELYLCTSNFTLALLTALMAKTLEIGVDKVVWEEVDRRQQYLERALAGTPLTIQGSRTLPVAWLDCSKTGFNDLQFVSKLHQAHVALLPGRFFYWNSARHHEHNVRLSLMKPDESLFNGVETLRRVTIAISEPYVADPHNSIASLETISPST